VQELGNNPTYEDGGDPELKYFRYLEDKIFNIVIRKRIQYKAKNTGQENQNWTCTESDISVLQDKEYSVKQMTAAPFQLLATAHQAIPPQNCL